MSTPMRPGLSPILQAVVVCSVIAGAFGFVTGVAFALLFA